MEKKQKYECYKKLMRQFDDVVQHYCTASRESSTTFAAGCMRLEYYGPAHYIFWYGPFEVVVGGKKDGKSLLIDRDDKCFDLAYEVAIEISNFWDEMVDAIIRYDRHLIDEEEQLKDRIAKNELDIVARERDERAAREREIEAQIFQKDRVWSKMEMDDILKCYHDIKIDRAGLSEQLAKLFMMAKPRERRIFANSWFQTDEGQRKLRDVK